MRLFKQKTNLTNPNIFNVLRYCAKAITTFGLAFIFITSINADTRYNYSLDSSPQITNTHSDKATGPHIQVAMITDYQSVTSGQEINIGIRFTPDEMWHTYWRNPGDSGEAPTIELQSNKNLRYADIQWPIPSAIPVAHLMNYGFDGENILTVPVKLPSNLSTLDDVIITAKVSWLVCKEDCIPGWATLQLTLPIQEKSIISQHKKLFENTFTKLPQAQKLAGLYEVSETQIVIETSSLPQSKWHLYPFRSDIIDHASQQTLLVDEDKTRSIIPKSPYYNHKGEQLEWLISDGKTAYYLTTDFNQISANAANGQQSILQDTQKTQNKQSLFIYVLMAFAGGLILNLMPCVLPILSIKALALQNIQSGMSHKLAYLLGVLFCFNAFALTIVVMQQMGQQIGWGFHMQSPVVVALLAFLFTFIALVLLDALVVATRFASLGQNLVEGNTLTSHFATGALAVIVASPCTAPFMAAALGIAFISEPFVTFILFNALAIGFALPLSVLFWSRKALKFLPKPGAWMETFKHFLAFPMLLTVAWLVWVFAGQAGSYLQFLLMLCLIIFSMFAWALGRSGHIVIKLICVVGLMISFAAPITLSFNSSDLQSNAGNNASSEIGLTQSKAFSRQVLSDLRNDNQVVLVNMTADWCITCKVNEQVALTSNDVIDALAQEGVVYIVGDWTNKNTEILEYLSQYERAGVPLYVVYAGNQKGKVLPQILTPNMVINAINTAKEDLQK